ncbi:MAG: nitroreductase family protein [Planctomycetota bacterium]|jgi:nitroreductase
MNLDDCIRNRRSVRSYTSDPVPDEEIREIVALARFSPSWVNSQCVRYLVIRDDGAKGALAETLSGRNPAREALRKAPVVVVFLAKMGLAGCKKGEPVDDRAWHMFDAGAAVQTFCLAAYRRGLGTVIVGYFDHQKAAELLRIPPEYEVMALTPLGTPDGDTKAPPRKAPDELLAWERFGLEDPGG